MLDNRSDAQQDPKLHLHRAVSGLSRSRHSCVLCAIIWEQLQILHATAGVDFGGDVFGVPLILPGRTSAWGLFVLAFLYVRQSEKNTILPIYRHELRGLQVVDMTTPSNIGTWPSGYNRCESLSRIENWLREDTPSRDVQLPQRLPTRLLHFVPPKDIETARGVRLVETSGLDRSTRYAALSHRWGNKMPLRLLEKNIKEFSHGIHWGDIPKTFRDAIELASSLDIHYLWIDSLCIIQDSKEDWEAEAALMGSIYLGAYVTISASAADDSSTGTMPESMLRYPCHVTPTWTGFEDFEELTKPLRVVDRASFCYQVLLQPLFKRGWVFQEWILSRKTIHCARDQLWWSSNLDAKGFAFNETCNGYQFEVLQMPGAIQTMSLSELYSMKSDGLHRTRLSPRMVWVHVVEDYMTRHFTFESDRLIALAGIATVYQHFSGAPDDSYLAGLWRHSLLQDLLWTTQQGRQVCPPQFYRGPSWSWASVEPIHYPDPRFSLGYIPEIENVRGHWVAAIEHTQVDTNTGSRFGPPLDAHIVLRGPLIKAYLSAQMVDVSLPFFDDPSKAAEFFPGGIPRYVTSSLSFFRHTSQSGPLAEAEAESQDGIESRIFLDDTFPSFCSSEPIVVYLAILGLGNKGEGYALILVRGYNKGEYRRIGYVNLLEEKMYPWNSRRNFGVLHPSEYLQAGDKAGFYLYRIV